MAEAKQFNKNIGEFWGIYSKYAHPSDIALKILIGTRDDGAKWLRLGGDYDELLFIQSVDLFCFAAESLFAPLYELSPVPDEFQARSRKLRTEIAKWRAEPKGVDD